MKVLLVSDYGTPTGGAELMLLTLRDGLRARGHDVRFFSSDARPLSAEIAADDTCFGTTSRWRTLLQCANPWAVQKLRATLAEFQPDVVHVRLFLTQLSPLILSLLRDVPSVLHVDSYRVICPTGSKRLPNGTNCQTPAGIVCYRSGCLPLRDTAALAMQMMWWRRHVSAFDVIVSSSAFVKRRLAKEGIDVATVVPNGVAEREVRPPAGQDPVVCFAGRLVPEKGVGILIEALSRFHAEFPSLRVLIAGAGPERAVLEVQCRALGLGAKVQFLGHLGAEDRERCFSGAWVQVVPSVWEEPFGNVAPEAMMRGTAVIASDTGGLTEIVAPENSGVLVPPGDPGELARALRTLLFDRGRCEEVGALGRRRALEQYTADLHVERMSELHASLVD